MRHQVLILVSFLIFASLLLADCVPNLHALLVSQATSVSPTVNPPATPAAPNAAGGTLLTYIPGSTAKLEQLLGEEDKQLHQPTLSQTFTRYGIQVPTWDLPLRTMV